MVSYASPISPPLFPQQGACQCLKITHVVRLHWAQAVLPHRDTQHRRILRLFQISIHVAARPMSRYRGKKLSHDSRVSVSNQQAARAQELGIRYRSGTSQFELEELISTEICRQVGIKPLAVFRVAERGECLVVSINVWGSRVKMQSRTNGKIFHMALAELATCSRVHPI
jgi:hypothetical protein